MVASMTISDLISALLASGMKQEDIARRLGIKRPNISNLKNGKQNLDDNSLPILAEMVYERLGERVDVDDLRAHKWLQWVLREKCLNLQQIQRIATLMEAESRKN